VARAVRDPGNEGNSASEAEAMMDPESAEMLKRLRRILRILRFRQQLRWRAKVCTISYREDRMLANLIRYVGELERRRAGRRGS
jgi:hypothetical protein